MEMPPVHLCVFLTDDHGRLKNKIVELKSQITQLEHTIRERNLDQSRSCSISCQTDLTIQLRPIPSAPPTIRVPSRDEQELHRLVAAQNELLKKHDYEALQRRQQQPPSSSSPLSSNVIEEVDDLKFAVQQATRLNDEYEKTIQMLSTRLRTAYPIDGT